MKTIAQLIEEVVTPEVIGEMAPARYLLEIDGDDIAMYTDGGRDIKKHLKHHTTKAGLNYQYEVFLFLLRNKCDLGINEVWFCQNQLVDGFIKLTNGQSIPVEIKYRMNWRKALQAVYQIRKFCESNEAKNAIVFFEEFEGDGWHRTPQCRILEDGWNRWYSGYSTIDRIRVDLLRIRNGEISHYNLELLLHRFANLSDEDKDKILAGMKQ